MPVDVKFHELPTLAAALKWWLGRKGSIPLNLKDSFEHAPPLDETELSNLIERIEHTIRSEVTSHVGPGTRSHKSGSGD